MAIKGEWYECDSSFIAAHHQPALLLDLGISRDVDSHLLLRGTQLFVDDILTGKKRISPQQFLTLIANTQKHLAADDTSFLYGERLLPGHYGDTSQVLHQSANLRQAIQHLCDSHALLSPLLTPRIIESDTHLHIYWLDSCGAGDALTFLVEASMMAVASMTHWLSGERMPWRYSCTYAQPPYIEQYWVHMNEEVAFDQQLNMMSLPLSYLNQAWSGASTIALRAAQVGSQLQMDALEARESFLGMLYNHLRCHIRQPLNLDGVAEAFGMSPASFKRKLQKHNTHFQEQLDLARMHVALYLYEVRGYSNQDVAHYLRFNDLNNFRRSFKRWTGATPGRMLAATCR